ncbi:MAG: hypothetical protein P8J45_06710 [Phycisphaerales bacterium]|nr:hypothetical protein [Phycisphaerales bacterium]
MNFMVRIGWMLWALVPVAVVVFHFGPGQHLAAREVAVARLNSAIDLEQSALEAQAEAYSAHLESIQVRRAMFIDPEIDLDPQQLPAELEQVLARERSAYDTAAERWGAAADAYEQVEELLTDVDQVETARIRWSKARARVRSGAIWDGAADLEQILTDMDEHPDQVALSRAAREELAVAHYFGARLLRLAGEPAKLWRAEAIKSRQHFRYLAETATETGASGQVVRSLEDNVERTIELEQMDMSDLEARPLPRESPRGMRGRRPGQGRPGITQQPPTRRDGRGAGGAGPVGPGW